MTGRRANGQRQVPFGPLRWSPPALSSPTTYNVTNDPATRNIVLGATEDAVIVLPSYPLDFVASPTQNEAILQVVNGRNYTIIGGQIRADPGPLTCFLSAPMTGTDMVVNVNSTAGFPNFGTIRVDGEQMLYTSKTATTFVIDQRRYGYYNDSPYSSDQAHATGTIVYRGEYARSCLSISNLRGQAHVEGLAFTGMVGDAVRTGGTTAGQVTLSCCRSDPSTNHDPYGQRDAHPDAVQVVGGCTRLRMERDTWRGGRSGRGFLNSSTDTPNPLQIVDALDTEWIMTEGGIKALDNTADQNITWNVWNCYVRAGAGSEQYRKTDLAFNSAQVIDKVGYSRWPDQGPDFCPTWLAGIGYASPGYL